jgi:hypothetical protein
MPTGHGKSAIYQVPALLLDGPTVVVSPLIALQRDQIIGMAAAADLPEAVAVNSAQSRGAGLSATGCGQTARVPRSFALTRIWGWPQAEVTAAALLIEGRMGGS